MDDVATDSAFKALSQTQRQLVTAILSAVCYGGWAYYINISSEARLISAFVQFLGSFFAGYFIASAVEWVFFRLPRPWRVPVAATLPYWSALLILALIHYWAGTAEVAKTLYLNFFVGTFYFIGYCQKLQHKDQ